MADRNLEITKLWKPVVFKDSLNGFKIQWDLGHLIPLDFFESLGLGQGCAHGDTQGTPNSPVGPLLSAELTVQLKSTVFNTAFLINQPGKK